MAALTTSLPCPECSAHYNAWYRKNPVRFSTFSSPHRTMLNWVLSLHNAVNRRAGKGVWKPEQIMANYRDLNKARADLEGLQSVIGDAAYRAATTLLASLAVH